MSIRSSFNLAMKVAELKAGEVADKFRERPAGTDRTRPYGMVLGGMLAFEETPFILMGSKGLQVTRPEGQLLVQAHGSFSIQGERIHRFYLSDGKSFLQAASDAQGREVPGELRLFQQYDEIHPATEEEWDFWLAEEDGYIGYPLFQTADERFVYSRLWSPGEYRVDPVQFTEQVRGDSQSGQTVTESHQAMLYARYAPEPAEGEPPSVEAVTELMLVSAVESPGEAWVEIHVGLDLDPTYLRVL